MPNARLALRLTAGAAILLGFLWPDPAFSRAERTLQKDYPIRPVPFTQVLLDDVFSELDLQRRKHLLALVTLYQQVLITATDLDCFDSSFLAGATRFRVSQGNIESA